jgi:hypothetical protein
VSQGDSSRSGNLSKDEVGCHKPMRRANLFAGESPNRRRSTRSVDVAVARAITRNKNGHWFATTEFRPRSYSGRLFPIDEAAAVPSGAVEMRCRCPRRERQTLWSDWLRPPEKLADGVPHRFSLRVESSIQKCLILLKYLNVPANEPVECHIRIYCIAR